ncbi:nephrin [Uranotaenia lowii]|uniref:nephrin n=1 Tax=Uranotaenia lowii TaxID=190385 RepID=UPI00247A2323|nr:nephrin [Uranotaenia lowii]XP_055603400.1 nephrin [Uranotaenia lowii]XP_055603401.1 nephrin [Uranotaenia lowii]
MAQYVTKQYFCHLWIVMVAVAFVVLLGDFGRIGHRRVGEPHRISNAKLPLGTLVDASSVIGDENGPLYEVQTAVGLDVSLPCDLLPTTMTMLTDKVTLVIWYKEGNTKPIYSFDARGKSLQQAIHWSDEAVLKSKAYFYYETNPPVLRIKNVKQDDAGLYRCRVDFLKSPTKNCRIDMDVLVPPSRVTILDDQGAEVQNNVVGPYREHTDINLTCISSGGIPTPKVTWWKEHALLDDSFMVLPDGTVKNVLYLEKLTRSDLNSIYTCQASNGHVVPPLSTAVKLDMKLPPLNIQMVGLQESLTAGITAQVSCQTAGSRPAPSIVWHKGGTTIRGTSQTTSNDGNVTLSELVFSPGPEDNEKSITCSITYDEFGDQAPPVYLKDSRTLNVRHVPVISLSLGAPLNSQNLMEGSDVYLECDIKSNPPVKKIEWFHNNKQLQSSRGIIISNQTLVLQSITKATHGEYQCRAANALGSVSSNQLYLDIKYPPGCKSEAQIIRAAVKQTVNITCDIDANPMPNLLFRWQFNNSLESMQELPPYTNVEPAEQNPMLLGGHHLQQPSSMDGPILDGSSHPHLLHHHHQLASSGSSSSSLSSSSSSSGVGSSANLLVGPNLEEMVRRKLERQQMPPKPSLVDGQLYLYRIESFSSFGTVTCTATNTYGQSGHCLYHILVADVPDPIKSCTVSNVTAYTVHISCIAGKDGGIPQQFHVDIFDENTKKLLFSITFHGPEMLLKKLPSDTRFIIKITPFNLQGTAPTAYRVKAQTLPAPLLRTAPSKAVLVQLTPLLGALVGAAITLFLVAICIIIFVKFKTKKKHHPPGTTEQDKGSAEPLSRNIGSHSSIDDKNPDVIPHENSEDDEEKQFERLTLDTDRLKYTVQPPLTMIMPNNKPTSGAYSPMHLSPTGNGLKKFGELSLTTNPSYAIYNSPVRSTYISATSNLAGTTTTTTVLPISSAAQPVVGRTSGTTSPNIYTRLPLRDFTPVTYDSMLSTSQTSSLSSNGGGPGGINSQIYTAKMPLLTTNYAELASLEK